MGNALNSYVHKFTKLQIEFGIKEHLVDIFLDLGASREITGEGGGGEKAFGHIGGEVFLYSHRQFGVTLETRISPIEVGSYGGSVPKTGGHMPLGKRIKR